MNFTYTSIWGRRQILLTVILVSIAVQNLSSAAQQPATPHAEVPVFDVASIHQNLSVGGRSHIISSAHESHFTTINVNMKSLLRFAFAMPESRILYAPAIPNPSWLHSDMWDIDAKADNTVDEQLKNLPWEEGKAEKRQMLQSLLADRFKLTFHRETREMPVFALVVAKGGPKLLPTKENGTMVNTNNNHINIQGGDSTVALLAEELAKQLDRVILDQTGITGRYDIDLKWTTDDNSTPASNNTQFASPDLAPSIFTALQEQLGLRLESQKAQVEVIIIDHIEPPSAN
jgi:uncharacterized protein (TIGR03435 family)